MKDIYKININSTRKLGKLCGIEEKNYNKLKCL